MHSLGIVQWNSIRRDHSRNPGGVSGLGPVNNYDQSPFKLSQVVYCPIIKVIMVPMFGQSKIL